MALGQAPLGWWAATVLAGYAVFALLPSAPRDAMRWLWLAGLGYFGLALVWVVQPFFVDASTHGWMAPFALLLLAGGMALFWAGAGLVARHGPALVAVAFLALEMTRGWVFTGFPVGNAGACSDRHAHGPSCQSRRRRIALGIGAGGQRFCLRWHGRGAGMRWAAR